MDAKRGELTVDLGDAPELGRLYRELRGFDGAVASAAEVFHGLDFEFPDRMAVEAIDAYASLVAERAAHAAAEEGASCVRLLGEPARHPAFRLAFERELFARNPELSVR